MDFHRDKKVNYTEFLAATISSINFYKEERLWLAFKYFDTTDSGFITLDSVMEALKDSAVIVDKEGLNEIFEDLKKKGKKINFNEFKAIVFGNQDEYNKEIDQGNEKLQDEEKETADREIKIQSHDLSDIMKKNGTIQNNGNDDDNNAIESNRKLKKSKFKKKNENNNENENANKIINNSSKDDNEVTHDNKKVNKDQVVENVELVEVSENIMKSMDQEK